MSRAQITRIVPVSDQILLLVFKDTKTEKYDVKFLLHRIPDMNPRSDPKGFKAYLYANEHVISEWESNIKFDSHNSEGKTTEVTLSASEDEWAEIEATCASMNVTVEQFALALAYFCIEPGAKKALNQWYVGLISKENNCL